VGNNFNDNNFKNKSDNYQLTDNNNNCEKLKNVTVEIVSSNCIKNSSVNSSNNTYIHSNIPVYNMFDVLYLECEDLIEDVFSDNDADQRDSEVGGQQDEANDKTSSSAVLPAQPNLDYDKLAYDCAIMHSCKSVEGNRDIQIKNGHEGQSGGLGAESGYCSDKRDCVIGLGNQWYSLTTDYDHQYKI
jgi:hypothetical protein